MIDLVLLCLYCSYHRHTTYMLSSLSYVSLIIPQLSCVFPIVLPIYHIHADDISTALRLCHRICCNPYQMSLSSSVYDFTVFIKLRLPCSSNLPPSLPSHISAYAILIVIPLCFVCGGAVSVVLHICCCRAPSLRVLQGRGNLFPP